MSDTLEKQNREIIGLLKDILAAVKRPGALPRKVVKRPLAHPVDHVKAVVGRLLELKGVANTDVAKNPKYWSRWMAEADQLLSALYGRVELADECMTEFAAKWDHLGTWGLSAIIKHAPMWLAEKQAQHSVVGGKR